MHFVVRGSAWDPAGGAYSAPPDHLSGGEEPAAPPQKPHLQSRPFGPGYHIAVTIASFPSLLFEIKY